MTILITGARGRVSQSLVRQLVEIGQKVRAAGRAPDAVHLPADVEVVKANLAEPDSLGPALAGVTKVFLYAEPSGLQGFVTAAREAGVEHIVLLSARGADPAAEDAIMRAHGEAEAVIEQSAVEQSVFEQSAVEDSGITWTFLRPGGFATNRLWWADSVREHGLVRDPFPASHSALIHEADIAAVAVRALTEPGHEGARYTLTGPESLTGRQQAELISQAIGRPLRVETQDLDDYRRSLSQWPAQIVEARIRRLARLVEHQDPTTDTVRELTGRPARTFAEWAADHASDFAG
jgi:uncharacterized protein YbjT (DUF2867 family)